jgi:hypothetical protein
MSTSLPIACTLPPQDYADRLAWITELNRGSLRAARREGTTLRLEYALDAEARVRELMRREHVCCGFLRFAVRRGDAGVELEIGVPQGAVGDAATLLAPFLEGAPLGVVSGPPRGHRLATVAATSGAVAALACGVCCALPLALPGAALSGVGAVLGVFGGVYRWATWLAVALVTVAWGWVWWERARSGKRVAASTFRVMLVATALLGVALSWPMMEGVIGRAPR